MNWFIIAMLAPMIWAICNFIDKYLVTKYFKGDIGTLIVNSCLIGLPVIILIGIFKPSVFSINFITALLMILNGIILTTYLFPYFHALSKTDASRVVPIFQTIPVFSFFLDFFILKEVLSVGQILASLLIIGGAIGISLKRNDRKKIVITKDVLWLMLLSSFIVSINSLFFKFFALQLDFWTVNFWQYLGFFIFGLALLIFVKPYRISFFSSFKKNKFRVASLNMFNEVINLFAMIIFSFATLLAPLSLVWVINSFQPVFAFLIGIGLTLFFPLLIKEEISWKVLLQKGLFIILMIAGAIILGI